MNDIQDYFDSCIEYWIREHNLSREVATVRAIWWDCVEIWNTDKTWNDEKIAFINRYRQYKPYDPVPEEECVAKGNA